MLRAITAGLIAITLVASATGVEAQRGRPAAARRPTESPVREEAPESPEREEARALFLAGSAAVEGGRWADAVASFERAYALTDAPSALYNLAVALRALGRHREARDAFARLLERHTLADDLRANAVRMRSEEAARVAVLELSGVEEGVEHTVRLDGRDVPGRDRRPVVIETDAGPHTLIAEREGFHPFVWEGVLTDGQRETILAVMRPLARGDDTVWHVVLVVVGIAALGAGAAVLGWFLHEDAQVRPLFDNRFGL